MDVKVHFGFAIFCTVIWITSLCTLFSFLLYLWWDVVDLFFLLDWGRFLNLITIYVEASPLTQNHLYTISKARRQDQSCFNNFKWMQIYIYVFIHILRETGSLYQSWESEWYKQLRVMLGGRQQLEVKGIFAAWHFAMK